MCSECRPTRSVAAARWVLSSLALLVLAVTAALPTVAHALDCNLALNYHVDLGPTFGSIGDTYRIQLTLGTGTITGGALNVMDITNARFFLDCTTATLSTLGCVNDPGGSPAGSVVKFVGNIGDISTGCVDANGDPVGVTTTHAANSALPNEVIFTFLDGSNAATDLELPAGTGTADLTAACAFEFDVQILATSGDGTPDTIEQGFVIESGIPDAVCDNTLNPELAQPGALALCPACDDNNACNGVETCDPDTGECLPGTPLVCNDNNACNGVETCDPDTGCVPGTPLVCGDNNACNGVETCNPATGCVPGTPLVCNDNNACNGVETCNPATGCVPGTPLVCGDNNACNGVETCDPAEGCVPGTPLVCNDNNACTTDTCNPASGCVNTPISCGDNNACTTDTCNPASGCVNTPINCNDEDICTDDSCNPATGCVHTFDPGNDPSCAPPPVQKVPTLSEWGMAMMAALLVLLALVSLRRPHGPRGAS